MRVSRKPGLRIPHKTITLYGPRKADAYCIIDGVTYNQGSAGVVLSLPMGTVITLAVTAGGLSEYGVILVNDRMIRECGQSARVYSETVHYVVVEDADIYFGGDTPGFLQQGATALISVQEKPYLDNETERTIRFRVDGLAYIAKEGMTWRNWIMGLKYNDHLGSNVVNSPKEGFNIMANQPVYIESNNGIFSIDTADGKLVSADDEIMVLHQYAVHKGVTL